MFKKNLEKKETAKGIMKSKTIKKICKKGVAFGLAGILGVASFGGTVKAEYTSVTGSMGGYSCIGTLSTNGTSATATTIWLGGVADLKATARVYYWFGPYNYVTPDKETNKAFGAKATAKKQLGGGEVLGGRGIHKINVKDGTYTWRVETKVGKTPADAIVLK